MSDNTEYDYTKFVGEPIAEEGSTSLAVLSALAQKQLDAEAEVLRCQAQLTRAQEKLKEISERQLPEAMETIGMKTFATVTGLVVTLDQTIRAAVPKAMRDKAWAWMRANGHAALIKRKVMVEFGKGEDEKAAALAKKMNEEYSVVSDESGVHPSTLAAFVREQMTKGKEIPIEMFGVHKQNIAKIERPK